MNAIDIVRMDKSIISVISLSDESTEKGYWQSKTPFERLEALELMRQINYGYDPIPTRLQRFLEVAQQTSR